MISAFQRPILSDPATQFIEALAQDAISDNYDLRCQERQHSFFIRAITIVAVQNLAYELWLFRSATNFTAAVGTDKFIGVWQFAALTAGQPGFTVGGGSLFRYYIDGLMVPYWDEDFGQSDGTPQGNQRGRNAFIHARLVNRSATGKNAGATGAVQLTFWTAVQGMQV